MHILFLTDNFPPEVNAPATRTYDHARQWVRAGHDVTVITCAPNFPDGKLFAGYRNRLIDRETMDGIEVVRVWTYITANEGVLRRSLDYASFMVSATLAGPFMCRPDIVVATSPQIFTALAGYLVSRMLRVPFVFELRDLWPEAIAAVGAARNPHLLGALRALANFLYRKADAIVAVTRSFRADLISHGIDAAKIHVVTNGADLSQFSPRAPDADLKRVLGFEDRFVAGYVGTLGMAHGLETVLDAAAQLRAQGRADIGFLMLGGGAEKSALKARAEARGLDNIVFHDAVQKTEIARYWSILDAAIIHLRAAPLFETVIPSKLFEAMAMGVPVLHGVDGESAQIVEQGSAGLRFTPEDARGLAAAVARLADDPILQAALGMAGVHAAGRFDRNVLAAEMLKVLEKVADGRVADQAAQTTFKGHHA